MKKLYILIILLFSTFNLFSQSGTVNLKYPTVVPSLRVGSAAKVRLDSIVSNVDTIKFYTGSTELRTKGSGSWTGSGIGLDTTLAKVTLGIDQVTNESKSTMFNNSSFTGSVRFNDGLYPGLTDPVRQIGTVGNEWNRFYLSTNGYITWNNSIFLMGDAGQISLSGGNLSLGSNNLLLTGNIGTSSSRANLIYADTLIANHTNITLDGYAPLNNPIFQTTIQVPAIWPIDSASTDIGLESKPFETLYLSGHSSIRFGTSGYIWGNPTSMIFNASRFDFYGPILIDNNDIGESLQRVRKGWFTDLEITNLPTVNGVSIASIYAPLASPTFTGTVTGTFSGNLTGNVTGDVSGNAGTVTGFSRNSGTLTLVGADAVTLTTTAATDVTLPTTGTLATTGDINTLKTEAEVGIALADSTGYGSGNYLPRYSAEQLIASMGGGSGATGVSLATELQSLGASVKAIPIFCDMDASTSYTLLDSTIYVTAVYIPVAETITGVRFSLSTQGNYTADGNNRVGLYKVSGTTATLVASTANNGDLWKGDQYAWTNHAFSSSYNAEAGAYYIGFLYNYSAQTTAPEIYCGEAVALGSQSTFMGNSVRIRGTFVDRSDLPSSFNMTWASTKTESPMIILY